MVSEQIRAIASLMPVNRVSSMELNKIIPAGAPVELERIEADMVAELAGAAHRAGKRFVGWPELTRFHGRDPEGVSEIDHMSTALWGFVPVVDVNDPRIRHVHLRAEVAVTPRE